QAPNFPRADEGRLRARTGARCRGGRSFASEALRVMHGLHKPENEFVGVRTAAISSLTDRPAGSAMTIPPTFAVGLVPDANAGRDLVASRGRVALARHAAYQNLTMKCTATKAHAASTTMPLTTRPATMRR